MELKIDGINVSINMQPQRLTPLQLLQQPQQQLQDFSVFINSTNNLTSISIQKEKLNLAQHVLRPNTRQRVRNRTPPRRTNQRPLSPIFQIQPDRPVRTLLDFTPLPQLNTPNQLQQIPVVTLENTLTPIEPTRRRRTRKTIL
jgi:hypothetical protein